MGRPCCCDCCGCTIGDPDCQVDGVTEVWQHFNTLTAVEISEAQTDRGSNRSGCIDEVTVDDPPCLRCGFEITQTGRIAYEVTVNLAGLTGVVGTTINRNCLLESNGSGYDPDVNGLGAYYYVELNGGGDLQFRVTYYDGITTYTATYSATVTGATMPLDGYAPTSHTLNFVASDIPNTANWPSTVTILKHRFEGDNFGSVYYRFYDSLTWTPDGGDGPRIGGRMDYRYITSQVTGDSTGNTAINKVGLDYYMTATQGGEKWFCDAMWQPNPAESPGSWGEANTTWHRKDSEDADHVCVYDWPLMTWWRYYLNGSGNPAIQYVTGPDLTNGEPDITFGVGVALHGISGSAISAHVEVNLDSICLRVEPPL